MMDYNELVVDKKMCMTIRVALVAPVIWTIGMSGPSNCYQSE